MHARDAWHSLSIISQECGLSNSCSETPKSAQLTRIPLAVCWYREGKPRGARLTFPNARGRHGGCASLFARAAGPTTRDGGAARPHRVRGSRVHIYRVAYRCSAKSDHQRRWVWLGCQPDATEYLECLRAFGALPASVSSTADVGEVSAERCPDAKSLARRCRHDWRCPSSRPTPIDSCLQPQPAATAARRPPLSFRLVVSDLF
jgi:hypothetical protein